jgi:hypothetical protein
MNSYGRVAKIWIDPEADEAYLSDGYFNKRVAVVDADSGELKRNRAPTATSRPRIMISVARTSQGRNQPSSSVGRSIALRFQTMASLCL